MAIANIRIDEPGNPGQARYGEELVEDPIIKRSKSCCQRIVTTTHRQLPREEVERRRNTLI